MRRDRSPLLRVLATPVTSADLLAVVLLAVLTAAWGSVGFDGAAPLRAAVGLVAVLFAPGYALVSALYPERPPSRPTGGSDRSTSGPARPVVDVLDRARTDEGVDTVERIALALALSLALIPLVLIGTSFAGVEYTPAVTRAAVVGTTTLFAVVAAARRLRVPAARRSGVSLGRVPAALGAVLPATESRGDGVLNVVLALAIVFAAGSLAVAVVVPPDGERFTDVYVVTEGDDDEPAADGYPTEFVAGQPQSVTLGIENREHEATEYTVVAELHRLRYEDDGNTTTAVVTEEERLSRFRTAVDDGATRERTYQVSPTMTGENLRLSFLVYEDELPADPTTENAYRHLHLWVSVDG